MSSHVCSLSVLVMLSLGYVLSRGGVEEDSKVFTAEFDVIRPWDNCKLYNDNITECGVNLYDPTHVSLENYKDVLYIMKLKIGRNKQEFRVDVDTGSGMLWVFGEGCDDKDANCRGHSKYDPKKSITHKKVNDNFAKSYGSGKVAGKTFKDTVYLAVDMIVSDAQFGVAESTDISFPFDGILGLNMKKTGGEFNPFLQGVKEKAIKEPIFGIYLNRAGSAADGGLLTLGGVTKQHFHPDSGVSTPIIGKHKMNIALKKVALGGKQLCKAGEGDCIAHVDTGCSTIQGPAAKVTPFITSVLKTSSKDNWVVDCKLVPTFPPLEFTIEGKTLTLEADYYTYYHKVHKVCFSKLRPNKKDMWKFGDPFLVKYYTGYDLKVDHEKITFWLAK